MESGWFTQPAPARQVNSKEARPITDPNLEAGIRLLAQGGLNLFAVLDCAALPAQAQSIMQKSGVPLANYKRLVLFGHGGRRMWQALQEWGMKTADPVDYYSVTLTRQFIRDCLDDSPSYWLYPDTNHLVPLQQLGETSGWSYPSPLGSGISPIYGVWFAYRTAFLTNARIPPIQEDPKPSPCVTCVEKPCIQTCPVEAVQEERFIIDSCVNHRLQPESPCADRCLSRMACPYFPDHQYSLEQIQYHYNQSLKSLKAWNAENK